MTMKKILFCALTFMTSLTMNAQTIEVYKYNADGTLNTVPAFTTTDKVKVIYKVTTEFDDHLLPGKFTVNSSGKQVQFTKGNLYWDGGKYMFEDTQIACPSTWSSTHVGHFFWRSAKDYLIGYKLYMPYMDCSDYEEAGTGDLFWCGIDYPLTVEGTDKLYVLTGYEESEWYYLIFSRENASNLCKYGVTVTDGSSTAANCLIIAPDDYNYHENALKSSYTLDEINTLGLVCLPAGGYRDGEEINDYGTIGYFWSSSTYKNALSAKDLEFDSKQILNRSCSRDYGLSIRLVRTVE